MPSHCPSALPLLAALLAFIVVTLGAWVRLADAGLGCPDWPGCYGQPTPHHARAAIARAEIEHPHGPVSLAKAWQEMAHRYAAGTLGGMVLLLAARAARRYRRGQGPRPLPEAGLIALVLLQGLLGMWTVTLRLKPVVVSAHLLGGMVLFALLAGLALRPRLPRATPALRRLLYLALAALMAQIALGGWVSSHYAGLACAGFPTCNGAWWPAMDFGQGFAVHAEPGLAPAPALTAIQFAHRLGALVTAGLAGAAGLLLLRAGCHRAGAGLLALLALQIGLGIANVLAGLPLPLAVAHNAGAALLLGGLTALALAARGGARAIVGRRRFVLRSAE